MTGDPCTALDDTGQPCPCLAYREGENPTPPIRCLECLHGRSQHRGKEDGAKPSVASILRSIVAKGAIPKKNVPMEEAARETNEGLKRSFKKPASNVRTFKSISLGNIRSDLHV